MTTFIRLLVQLTDKFPTKFYSDLVGGQAIILIPVYYISYFRRFAAVYCNDNNDTNGVTDLHLNQTFCILRMAPTATVQSFMSVNGPAYRCSRNSVSPNNRQAL